MIINDICNSANSGEGGEIQKNRYPAWLFRETHGEVGHERTENDGVKMHICGQWWFPIFPTAEFQVTTVWLTPRSCLCFHANCDSLNRKLFCIQAKHKEASWCTRYFHLPLLSPFWALNSGARILSTAIIQSLFSLSHTNIIWLQR